MLLPTNCTISESSKVHAMLVDAIKNLSGPSSIALDASQVEKADITLIQMLEAIKSDGIDVKVSKTNDFSKGFFELYHVDI